MIENKTSTVLDSSEDDAPDLSTPEWRLEFAEATVQRGKPAPDDEAVSATIRLDPDIAAFFQSAGPDWRTLVNETLRASIREKAKA